jgi:hypothetical protein
MPDSDLLAELARLLALRSLAPDTGVSVKILRYSSFRSE